ncbi:hypothetical protein LVD15_00875 [Fulvivirga maritima]|uniref:hypothetical protein n=1 Tax=Fulvivirga maritima TaxID=2904247 RepID=UPI001F47E1DE|nr:hypothetical protein [Fulvivirga maritima]UII27022.1 hypothetical protein LVD15_00875 [Fulvivirga maritima]
MRKPFKDTKLGSLLKDKLPEVLDIVGDILPDQGILGVVKNLVQKKENISEKDRSELMLALNQFEVEISQQIMEDRANARMREIAIADHQKSDWLMSAAGITALGSFSLMVIAIVFIPLKNENIFHQVLGIVEGVSLTIFAYYFGSARQSLTPKAKK